MSEELAQKIGRGGAGNFYTKRDLDIARTQHEDVEAQKPSGSSHLPETHNQPPGYLRSGRGGVGNIIVPSDPLPSSSSQVKSATGRNEDAWDSKTARTKVDNKFKSDSYTGLSGRGGAGNWRQASGEEERRQEEEETKARTAVQEQVRIDVELGLKPPPKVYTGPENTVTGRE